ncbi:MAG: AarF/ABC1/UbiB kinase family protein [Campylobacterales bacterium]|nr:AarF/ABC1/UbiB kinase family protein [Campylobacterales bacterium]
MVYKLYSPVRIWHVFQVLLTLYLLIRKRDRFLLFSPLGPARLVDTITSLGASFIKLAQVLATRNDFFPSEYLNALKMLHDELPAMSQTTMQHVFERAFKTNPFVKFNTTPIASASIGQVHEAWLDDGVKVAVKLRREGIERQVKADIRILTAFNQLFRPLFSHYTKHSIEAVIVEFSSMILKEVSLNHERANLIKFSQTYAHMGVRFPCTYEELSCDDALVMRFEEGFRFDDRRSLEACGIDIYPIIDTLVSFYTEQMLVKGYFHADPHPGNLLISKEGQLILLDFGMVKRVPNETRVAIIELIKAANEQDYERYVNASKRLGTVAYDAPVSELAEFTESMFEIFNNDTLDSASMQELAFEVLEKTRNLPFKLPQEAIYILRVSAIIEGLGTTYIENFNGIKDILPILQKNIPRALGAKESILETLIDEFRQFPLDIKAFRDSIYKISEENLSVELSKRQLEVLEKRLAAKVSSVSITLGLMLGAIFLVNYDKHYEDFALLLFGAGALRLFFLRSKR